MNVWLWILQRAPTTAPRWISTNGPMRVPSPIVQPYRLVKDWTTTPSPKETSSRIRYSASFAGRSATVEELTDRLDHVLELPLRDPGVDRQRQQLVCER